MRLLAILVALLLPMLAHAQSRSVLPHELELTVTVEETEHTPLVREMVLITIRGIYRRHVTREQLQQPDFDGFSWTQLGPDVWREERIAGEAVKTMTRRMAIYPDRAGRLTIGAFVHKVTLTDEQDGWFEHEVLSEPLTLDVAPAPETAAWWFPVRELRISDQWSNAPDQLKRGEGVLRVIRLEAVGVTPEMIPPMPDLVSPSGMIFAHPDKRLVELSPDGPITYAFWRWTIRPGNDISAVVEPLTLHYYDTVLRAEQTITISAQRIAYGDAVPSAPVQAGPPVAASGHLPGWGMLGLAGIVFALGLALDLSGRRLVGLAALRRFALLDPLARGLRNAARAGDGTAVRRLAARMLARDGAVADRGRLLSDLDSRLFAPHPGGTDLAEFARAFLRPTPLPEAREGRPRGRATSRRTSHG